MLKLFGIVRLVSHLPDERTGQSLGNTAAAAAGWEGRGG